MHTIPEYYTFDDVLLLPRHAALSREDISIETTLTAQLSLAVPFISSPMDTVTSTTMALEMSRLGGLGILHRNTTLEALCRDARMIRDGGGKVVCALGPTDEAWLAQLVREVSIDGVVLDNAHADSAVVVHALDAFKRLVPEVMVGNMVTADAAQRLIEAGASALKVGIGSGSICTTRTTTGVGAPQLSALLAVAEVAKRHGVSVLADGGIRGSADIAKALAAGADAVVLGSLLAATSCAPGELVEREDGTYKSYRGMGSEAVMQEGYTTRYNQSYLNVDAVVPEGVSGMVPYKGETRALVAELAEYLRSSMYYCGARSIQELHANAQCVRMTSAGAHESGVHSVRRTD